MDQRGNPFTRRRFLTAVGVYGLAGCVEESGTVTPRETGTATASDTEEPTPTDVGWEPPTESPRVDIEIETLVENLEIPWGMTFTSNDELFLTERTGTVLRFDSDAVRDVLRPEDAIDAGSVAPGTDEQPWWVEGGEGGTLGIAAHPTDSYVYVYYTADGSNPRNRVVRYDIDAGYPSETVEPIVDDIPANVDPGIHNGGRIAFGPEGNLWLCTGDAHNPEQAGDVDSLAGKILRVSPDGEPLDSNPDLDGDPRVYTYGHRNPQGIDWLPNGTPVINEHGPNARDEMQILRPGGDYGWNRVRGGPNDDEWGSYTEYDDVVPPLLNTGPGASWAPTGSTFYTGDDVSAWHNRYIVGGLISQSVWVVTLTPPGGELPPLDENARRFDADWLNDSYTVTAHRHLHDELGRVRYVTQSPAGEIYAITSNRDGRASGQFPRERDDVLVRLTT
jgi:glucose/arabinose dehydrogenase